MSEPQQGPAIAEPPPPELYAALQQLTIAAGFLNTVVWEWHAIAIPKAVEGLSQFYLHTEATGRYDPAPIYLDRDRRPLGLYPAAVEPLLDFLAKQTERLEAAVTDGKLGPASVPTLEHWKQRLAYYREHLDQAVAATGATAPSEDLWRHVTAPLIQGLYPAEFKGMGISDPSIPSKPDVTTVPTEIFVVLLGNSLVTDAQAWLLDWSDSVRAWRDQMIAALKRVLGDAAEAAGDGALRALWWLGAGLALTGGGYLLYRHFSQKGQQSS